MAPILGIYASQISGHLSTNNFSSIATVTVGSGGSSSVTFSSIPSTYTHLQLRIMGFTTGAVNSGIQFNGDSSGNYSYHYLDGNGSSASATGGTGANAAIFGYIDGSATYPEVAIIDILDYTNTNKYKTIRHFSGNDTNGSGYVWFNSSLWNNTAAITSISTPSATTYRQYSSFALYGVK